MKMCVSENVNSDDTWMILLTSFFSLFALRLHFNLYQRGGLGTQVLGKPCTQRACGREDNILLPCSVTGIRDVLLLCSNSVSISVDIGEALGQDEPA